MAMLTRVLAIILVALVSNIAGELAVTAQTSPEPAKASPTGANVVAMTNIEFYLARGEADACGRGCNEWIAAEGRIDPGAASRLRQLLTKLGGRRPPIYFNSPGGSMAGSLELGRLVHDQKFVVSIAHTLLIGCDHDKQGEASCEAQKRSGQGIEAEFDPNFTMCNSGCVYVIAGGGVRFVPPGVKLGIHDIGLDPATKNPPRAATDAAKTVAHERIRDYLREMGIDQALLTAAEAVPFESVRFLKRDEIARFGIDRREFGETGWRFVDKPLPEVSKSFFVGTDDDQHRYVDGFVSVGCGVANTIRLTLARQHVASETAATDGPQYFSLIVNGQRVELRNQMSSMLNLEMRSAWPSANTFAAVDDNTTIELSRGDLARNDESAGGMPLNVAGFSAQYAKLRKSCYDRRTTR